MVSMSDYSATRLRWAWRALALAVAVSFVSAAEAQDSPQGQVVATLDGVPITRDDLLIAAQEFGDQIARLPPDRQKSALLDVIIDIRLLSKAAASAGLDKGDEVARRLEFARARTLRNEYLKAKVFEAVTEAAVKKRFDQELATFVPGDQLHLRHILVKTEDEAKAVIADLGKGGDFAAIAAEKSLDPGSGKQGGDLGFVAKGATVKPFEDAAFKLEVGEITREPVQSEYGWHVIKLEEKRKQPPPTFEAEGERLRQLMIRETFSREIEALRKAAKLEIVDAPPAPGTQPAQ
jgi:peptidyl-prolyl cis-trans isomerase C